MRGIDVDAEQNVLGGVSKVDIALDHADQNIGAEQCKQALERFDESYRPQSGAMRVPSNRLALVCGCDTAHRLREPAAVFRIQYLTKLLRNAPEIVLPLRFEKIAPGLLAVRWQPADCRRG